MDVRVSSPIFIGRSAELARLRAALDEARNERSTKFLIAGEAGVGKTRLAAEFSASARQAGAVVLGGGCIDLGEGGIPYAPIIEALRTWVRGASEDERDAILGQARSELARLVPDLGPIEDTAPPGSLTIGSAQGRLFELLLGVLQRLASPRPVVLVVEDLHWSDRSTRDLLSFLVRNVRDMGVVLVVTYRSDELHRRHPLLPFVAELERSGRVERLDLGRFDRRELIEQLGAIAGPGLEASLIDSIHARSEGNPFFTEELLVSARGGGEAALPPTLREVLLAHVAGLSEAAQELLRTASAAGQRVDPRLLAAATGMDESTLYTVLREAVGHQILIPEHASGEERYAFRHALLQEAVYDDLLPGERTHLHAAFAQTLEKARATGDDSRISELAFHWYAAHDVPRAFEAALAAATAAEAKYAFAEALGHYERALELWEQVPDASSRAALDLVGLLAAAAAVARLQEPQRAVAHARAAIALVDVRSDPVRAGLLHVGLGRYAWVAGLGELSLEAHRTALRLIPTEPPSEARATALAGLAQILMLQRYYAESRLAAEEAIEIARFTGARQIEGHALNTRAEDRVHDGEAEEALEDLTEALRIAEELDNIDDICRAYANRADVLYALGRLEEGAAAAFAGLGVARRLGVLGFFGTHFLCEAAELFHKLGRWDETADAVRRAEEIGTLGINAILSRELRGRLALGRGDLEEAARILNAVRPLAVEAADGQVMVPVHASLAELALWQRRPAEAAAVVDAGLARTAHSPDIRLTELYALGARAHADLAELARARRSIDEERDAVSAGRALFDVQRERHAARLATGPALRPQSEAWFALSSAEMSRLEGAADPDAWQASVVAWESIGRPYPAAYSRWREAEALLAGRGDRKRAAATLARAAEAARTLGAEPLLHEVEVLATRARISLDQVVPPAPAPEAGSAEAARFGLTAREREVISLVAAGRTNRQIGEELFISEKTAGVHVSNILGKLGVAGRGEAAALAHQLGLADPVGTVREPGGA